MKLQQCSATNGNTASRKRPRRIGQRLLELGIAAVLAVTIVYGEFWALRQVPLLPSERGVAISAETHAMSPSPSADANSLPVAILH